MKNVKIAFCLMLAVLFMATGKGFGFTPYNDGGTHTISSTINDNVWVDYLTPGMQTTLNLVEGGNITAPYELCGYGNSRLMISGGSVGGVLCVMDNGQLTFSGGSVAGILRTYNNSLTTISGGSIASMSVTHSSQVTMSGGSVLSDLTVIDNGQLTFSNGSVVGKLWTYNDTLTTITGGSIGNLWTAHSSQVTMSDGSVLADFFAYDNSQVTMSGGTISGNLLVGNYAKFVLDGSNFAIDGTPVGFGEITSMLGGYYSNEPYRRLTGILANGDILNNQFQIGDLSSITLVPEPTSMLLLSLGSLLLRRRKK